MVGMALIVTKVGAISPPLAPVPHDELAQPLALGLGQTVKLCGRSFHCLRHSWNVAGVTIKQVPRVLPVKMRPPHQGQKLGVGIFAALKNH
jgi:hypothetical protein